VEKLIISHPHADHMAGLFSLTPEIEVDSVYLPDLRVPYVSQDRALEFLANEGIPYRLLSRGDILKVDGTTRIYILAPFKNNMYPSDFSGESINDLSVVCLLKSASSTILFTGDTEKDNEKKLIAWEEVLRSQVLMIGHHGSQTSSSFEFLRQVSPQYGLISVGENNRFDHPSQIILQRLKRLEILNFRTDLRGAVWMRSKKSQWELYDWR
jgi:competence protein ComEC